MLCYIYFNWTQFKELSLNSSNYGGFVLVGEQSEILYMVVSRNKHFIAMKPLINIYQNAFLANSTEAQQPSLCIYMGYIFLQ